MAYFPFFVDIAGKKGLIVGGGKIAHQKIQKLIPFAPHLSVVAPEILPEIEELRTAAEAEHTKIDCIYRCYEEADLTDAFFVIAATTDESLNEIISAECRARGIPVNVVDDRDRCSFLFPSLTHKGSLTVAVSTEGASPTVAAVLRRQFEALIPDHIDEILEQLAQKRELAREQIPDDKERAAYLKEQAIRALCFREDSEQLPSRDKRKRYGKD